jgi:ribosome-associated translation inhibitor RaiA
MLQVTFRHMSASSALRVVATELLQKLQTRAHGAERCHLVIDQVTAQHDHKPALISAHLDVSFGFPDSLFHATSVHADAAEAVREAFASIERQLTDRQKRQLTEARVDLRS